MTAHVVFWLTHVHTQVHFYTYTNMHAHTCMYTYTYRCRHTYRKIIFMRVTFISVLHMIYSTFIKEAA